MTPLLLVLLASGPCIYWTQGLDSRPALEAASIKRICVAADQAEAWRSAGFSVVPMSEADLAARETLPVPGVTARAGLASPTRSPWIVASGWRITRAPGTKYLYTVPAGKAAIAEAEAFAYGADAVLKIDAGDLASAGAMMTFLDGLPAADLPPLADLGVVDDGSPVTGEVMNLLARRNLLFKPVKAPAANYTLNVTVGSAAFPAAEAADPSAFAQKVRAQLTDDRRSLRVFGSEVVIGRLTGDAGRARLHLINYGGREIEGLRVRVRGHFQSTEAYADGTGRVQLLDVSVTPDAIEFSLPRLATYAVIDLR